MELHRKSEFEFGVGTAAAGEGAAGRSEGSVLNDSPLSMERVEFGVKADRPKVLPRTEPVTPRPDRRKDTRKPSLGEAKLRVKDPFGGQTEYEIQPRDGSLGGVAFLLKDLLTVGQFCEIETFVNGRGRVSRKAEVVRSRQLTNGKYEMAVQYRGPEVAMEQPAKRKRRR